VLVKEIVCSDCFLALILVVLDGLCCKRQASFPEKRRRKSDSDTWSEETDAKRPRSTAQHNTQKRSAATRDSSSEAQLERIG
jgi:hypothetical protein